MDWLDIFVIAAGIGINAGACYCWGHMRGYRKRNSELEDYYDSIEQGHNSSKHRYGAGRADDKWR